MARLRIRIELSRGGAGVPLHKVASVVSKSQKFLDSLSEDVHIDASRGEWLGFDFDRESLNFTAEYVGAVTSQQVEAFNAAFDGTTSLRRDTIAQFASITEAIGEDEIIGFGLYHSDEHMEPAEWRCLSRRDALRIAEGIQLLLGADQESHLPAARDPNLGARIFGDRREGSGPGDMQASLREMEKSLSTRIQHVERRVELHSGLIQEMREHSATTEASFRNLLTSVESFCTQATRRIETVTPMALPPRQVEIPAQPARRARSHSRAWMIVASAFVLAAAILAGSLWIWPASHPAASTQKDVAAIPAPAPIPAPIPAPTPIPAPEPAQVSPAPVPAKHNTQIELAATSPTWVSLVDEDGNKALMNQLLAPGAPRSFEVSKGASLRVGNAGGLALTINGKSSGPLGPSGQVRQIQIRDGRIVGPPQ